MFPSAVPGLTTYDDRTVELQRSDSQLMEALWRGLSGGRAGVTAGWNLPEGLK